MTASNHSESGRHVNLWGSTQPKVSIVIVNWNTRHLTLNCVRTVRQNTGIPFELILVDNGSNDGSVDAINDLERSDTKPVLLEKNLGFAGGYNAGIRAANGDMICLLNSDAFVTPGWIESLLACMNKTGASMAGPCTNNAKGKQRKKGYYRFIPRFLKKCRPVRYLSFFCVLIEKKVFDTIGYLDENFGIGTYEDDDFCRRALDAGFTLMIDQKSWVWHEAHATMTANNIDECTLRKQNRDIFESKWIRGRNS